VADEDLVPGDGRTVATSPVRVSSSSSGAAVWKPSFSRPAITWSQPDGLAQAPWTSTIVGRSAASTGFAAAVAGMIDSASRAIATMAITILVERGRTIAASST
jgi:hypothetical protein